MDFNLPIFLLIERLFSNRNRVNTVRCRYNAVIFPQILPKRHPKKTWTIWLAFHIRHFLTHLREWKSSYFDSSFREICSQWSNPQNMSIGLVNGLVPSGNMPLPELVLTKIMSGCGITEPQLVNSNIRKYYMLYFYCSILVISDGNHIYINQIWFMMF